MPASPPSRTSGGKAQGEGNRMLSNDRCDDRGQLVHVVIRRVQLLPEPGSTVRSEHDVAPDDLHTMTFQSYGTGLLRADQVQPMLGKILLLCLAQLPGVADHHV